MAAQPTTRPLSPGMRLGSLMTVERVLGQGGTAVVYAARHAYFSTPVAVKVVTLRHGHHTEARERLLREALLCSKLRDARLPKVYYADQLPDGSPYIVMEKVDGVTLRAAMSRGPLPLAAVASLGHQLLDILSTTHAASIVHRDVKPGNLIVERVPGAGLRLRLIDFGFGVGIADREDTRTDTSRVLGTPSYMAPEQLAGQPVDARADLYSAGVVLYELLAGRVPYRATSMVQLVESVSHDAPPPLAQLVPSVPATVAAVVERAIQKAPEGRFQTAAEMDDAWQHALASR